MKVPVLETGRLILREPRLEDFHAHAAIWLDPRMGDVQTEQESWKTFQIHVGNWQLIGWGYWTLIEKVSGIYIGTVGFQHARRPIDYAGRDAPEMGWSVAPGWQKQGFAGEAARAALTWADEQPLGDETWCAMSQDNMASQALARSVGYREVCRIDYKERPSVIFVRRRGGT